MQLYLSTANSHSFPEIPLSPLLTPIERSLSEISFLELSNNSNNYNEYSMINSKTASSFLYFGYWKNYNNSKYNNKSLILNRELFLDPNQAQGFDLVSKVRKVRRNSKSCEKMMYSSEKQY